MISAAKGWSYTLVAVISFCRVAMGMYNSLSGPTLLYLSHHVNVSIAEVSIVFSARSLGCLLGAITGGIVKRNVGPNFPHLLLLGICVGILGIMSLLVPWITQFWMLILDIIIGGTMYGYIEAGLQAVLLQLWGNKASRSLVQLYHLTFSVGAFITPLFASYFLSSEQNLEAEKCSDLKIDTLEVTTAVIYNNTATEKNSTIAMNSRLELLEFNPVGWTYVILAGYLILNAALLLFLNFANIEEKVSHSIMPSGHLPEDRNEEPLRDLIWLFLAIAGYYFCSVATTNVFYNFIYSLSICTLEFTVKEATYINSVYCLGLIFGRISGMFFANIFKPRTIVFFCIIGSIVTMIIICLCGETTTWAAWLGLSGLFGYTTSMMNPSGVSWISQLTNISGTYMFIPGVGNYLGVLTILPLAGILLERNPFSVMYLTLGVASANAGMFAFMLLAENRHKHFLKRKTAEENDDAFIEEKDV